MFFVCLFLVKPCQLPDDTPNGHYEIIRGEEFVFGTVIQYFCNQGYVDLHLLFTLSFGRCFYPKQLTNDLQSKQIAKTFKVV